MKVSRAMWILAAVFFIAPLAHADGTTTMQFTGVNGANNGVYYVSPYTGTMNYGTSSVQSVVLFCDDINLASGRPLRVRGRVASGATRTRTPF